MRMRSLSEINSISEINVEEAGRRGAAPRMEETDLLWNLWDLRTEVPSELHRAVLDTVIRRFFAGEMKGLEKQVVDTLVEFRKIPVYGIKNACEQALGRIKAEIERKDSESLLRMLETVEGRYSGFEIEAAIRSLSWRMPESGAAERQGARFEKSLVYFLGSSMEEGVLFESASALSKIDSPRAYRLVKGMVSERSHRITDDVRRMLRLAEECMKRKEGVSLSLVNEMMAKKVAPPSAMRERGGGSVVPLRAGQRGKV